MSLMRTNSVNKTLQIHSSNGYNAARYFLKYYLKHLFDD